MKALKLGAATLAAVVALGSVAACGRSTGASNSGSAPGVTKDSITIGASAPLTGPIAGYGVLVRSAAAYFHYVNAHDGGVMMADGVRRKINYKYYDDQYQPAAALQNAHRLVEQDHVFATVGVVGTPPSEAMRPYLNQQRVPEVFCLSATTALGSDYSKYPWTIGWPLTFATEGAIDANYLEQNHAGAKVAILYVDNDGGKDLLGGFKKAIAGTSIKIVEQESYEATDASVTSQMAKLAHSGANVFFNISTSKYTAQAISSAVSLNWHPVQLLASVGADASVLNQAGASASQGILSVAYLKDPSDPKWASDADMQLYRSVISKYGSGLDADNEQAVEGVAAAESFVSVLEKSQPTRADLMKHLRSMDRITNGLFLPGISMTTSANDPYPIESAYQEKFVSGKWQVVGNLISYEGHTPAA